MYIYVTDTHFITASKRSLRQGNIFAPVCHSVHRGGVPGKVPTRAGTPPGRYTPPAGTPAASTPGNACSDTVNKRAVRILLECILVDNFTAIFHQISSKIINVERLRNGITIISITILKFAETAVILPPAAIVVRGYCFHRRLSIHGGGVGMSLAMTTRCH